MLEIPFLKKQDSDDQLPSKETPMLLHVSHPGTNEQTSFLIDQDCPTLGEDTNGGDSPVDNHHYCKDIHVPNVIHCIENTKGFHPQRWRLEPLCL